MKTIFKTAIFIAIMVTFSCQNETLSDINAEYPQSDTNTEYSQASKSANAKQVTKKITNSLASDPDPNNTSECGGALFWGVMSHMGKVTGYTANKTCDWLDQVTLHITSDEVTYAANGDEMWSDGDITIHFPTDGSTIATITGGSTITGGTGRFEGASGWFVFENMVYDLITGRESHTAYGEITY